MDKFWLTLFGFVVLAIDRLTRRPDSAPVEAEPEPEEEKDGPPAEWQAQFGQSVPPAHWLKEFERAETQPEWLEYSELDGQSAGVWPLTAENQAGGQPEEGTAEIQQPRALHPPKAVGRTRATNRSPLLGPVSRNAFDARQEQSAEAEPSEGLAENPRGVPSPDWAHAMRPDMGKIFIPSPREDRGRAEAYSRFQPFSLHSPAGARSAARRGEEEQHRSPDRTDANANVGVAGRLPRADPNANYEGRAVTTDAITVESEHDPRTRADRPVAPTQKWEARPSILVSTRSALDVDAKTNVGETGRSPWTDSNANYEGRAVATDAITAESEYDSRIRGDRPVAPTQKRALTQPSPNFPEGARNTGRENKRPRPIFPVGDQSGKSKNPPLPPLVKGGKNSPALIPLDKGGQGGILSVHPFPNREKSTKIDPSWVERSPQAYNKWPSLDNDPPLDELDWAEAAQALEHIARLEREQGGL